MVTAAMLAALCCVATMIIKIPTPLKGYINAGDCVVILSGFALSPLYSFLAAGIGSALADVFSGYIVYAPATFVIKGLMAVIFYFTFNFFDKKVKSDFSKIFSSAISEIFMVAGYYFFEGILYGFIPSAANVPSNVIQGVAGVVLGFVLVKSIEKFKQNKAK